MTQEAKRDCCRRHRDGPRETAALLGLPGAVTGAGYADPDGTEAGEAIAITEEALETPPKSSSFTSSYVCRNGHRTRVYLILMNSGKAIGGSSWDFCHRCSEGPGDADLIRMPLEIFGMWLRAGMIKTEHYAELAHAAAGGK